jgi:hypothetical protein
MRFASNDPPGTNERLEPARKRALSQVEFRFVVGIEEDGDEMSALP